PILGLVISTVLPIGCFFTTAISTGGHASMKRSRCCGVQAARTSHWIPQRPPKTQIYWKVGRSRMFRLTTLAGLAGLRPWPRLIATGAAGSSTEKQKQLGLKPGSKFSIPVVEQG